MAKTETIPFGLNVYEEVVRNPYVPTAIAGSSQAGTAAAIAAGVAPIGIGTDALGSARAAASLTGTIAFKPSQDRYSLEGIATTSSTETPALFARSVKDIILIDSILTNTSADYSAANLSNLKIGIAQDYFYYPLERNTEKLIASFLTKLIVEGKVEMIETEVNQLSKLMPVLQKTLIDYELRRGISDYLDQNALSLADVLENLSSPEVLASLENADSISQSQYNAIKTNELEALASEFQDFIDRTEIEVFILPTTPRPAALIADREVTNPVKSKFKSFEVYTKNTQPSSFAGLPSITLPIGLTPDGLPVGIMLEGEIGDDSRLLQIALAVETLIGDIPLAKLP